MNWLAPFQFHMLLDPWMLLLLAAVAVLFVAELTAHAPGAMRISTGESLGRVRAVGGMMKRWLPPLLRALALALLVIALARPVSGMTRVKDRANVVDIMLCVDVSESMRAQDFQTSDGELRDRLFVTKAAVRDFIDSRKASEDDDFGLDRVGLLLYAGYAWTQCPLTLDYGILDHELERATFASSDAKQGTAIGSALGLAVSRLRKSEAESKVIILLTDGRNNRGEIDPITAAQIAEEYGIRVYTIGAGSEGEAVVPVRTLFGMRRQRVSMPLDVETLQRIADVTGGRFYRATDIESLQEAYEEINRLETTEIELGDYYEYEEAFMPYALAGGGLMALAVLARRFWLDPLP